jgi:hypothetical protein
MIIVPCKGIVRSKNAMIGFLSNEDKAVVCNPDTTDSNVRMREMNFGEVIERSG